MTAKFGITRRQALLSSILAVGMSSLAAMSMASDSLKIGAILDITGGASFLGVPEANAAKLAIKLANEAGGIDGKQVELLLEDGTSTETGAVLGTRKLISQSNVSAIVGPSRTGGALALLSLVTESEVPMLAPVSGVTVVQPVAERKWVFRPGQGGDLSVAKVVDYMERAGWDKVGILYVSDAYGEDGRDNLRALVSKRDVVLAQEESFPPDATDLKSQLTKLKNSGVDAIFMHGYGAPSVVVYRNARELGLGIPIISGHGQANSAFRDAVGEDVVGQPIVGAPVLVWQDLPDNHPQKAISEAFVTSYSAEYGVAPDMFAGVSFDATNMVIDAMRAVGGERQAIRDWLETNVKNYVGVTGVFNFSPEDHAGLTSDALVMMIATPDGWQLADYEK